MSNGSRRPSFAARALAAVALMIGFYVLAIGLVAALVGLAIADMSSRRIHPKLILVCGVAAFAVLRGIFFLADGWQAPGPEVTEADEPKLFAMIREVAGKMGARMPANVYLIPDVNAFVAEVGGWMGMFGTRRVMAIGVGMLNTDSVAQLKATIAHEFGHFEGGDTRLGGFLYRTRASIGRVVGSLGEDAWLSYPFKWYGALFMRLTQALSRRQELAADEFSVQVAGKAAHIEGLRREAVGGTLFGRFLSAEVEPLLREKYRPVNLFEGYRQFLENLGADGILTAVEARLDAEATDPYDSHPALRDRIAYAEGLSDVPVAPGEDMLSRVLLKDPERTERLVTVTMLSNVSFGDGEKARDIAWSEVGGTVYAARFSRGAKKLAPLIGEDGNLDALLDLLATQDRAGLAEKIVPPENREGADLEHLRDLVAFFATARVAVELAKLPGASWDTAPGRPVRIAFADGRIVDPHALLKPLLEDRAKVAEVRAELRTLGVLASDAA